MEFLDSVLHYGANLAMIGCSAIWTLCCWMCWKVHANTIKRIELHEAMIFDFHKRMSGFEYTLLMRRINGEETQTKE